jgi:iron complex outermembrane receptor protein
MTHIKLLLSFFLLLCGTVALAQTDSVIHLREVIISDTQLRDYSGTQQVQQLNDSVIRRSAASLTSLLSYNTVIYFKENGLGMVSSPSFRGTTAQQTAVIWNGLTINSQLNGQADFNILNAQNFSSVSVRPGGGSVIYGSSAIGGSIHLDNELLFSAEPHIQNILNTSYGSFNTASVNYNLQTAGKNFSTNLSITHNSSDNDYEYPGWDMKNENGQYYNTGINAAFAYKLNNSNMLRLYSYIYDGERHFSGTLAAPSKSKYKDRNTRSLLEWESVFGRFTSKLKAAYIEEEYKYYEDKAQDNCTFGNVKTYIARYDFSYNLTDNAKLNTIIDYTNNRGTGSDILNKKRNIGSASLLFKHYATQKFYYEAGIRNELTDVYQSPLLFSAGAKYRFTNFYVLKFNISRNFRIPTYNDLYWQGSGNPDLKPETSYQVEIGNNFTFRGLHLSVTGYYIKLSDMLRWVPSGSVWMPENVGKVNTYGAEAVLNWEKAIGNNHFKLSGTYAYTVSQEAGKSEQLLYVPLHKATVSAAYSHKKITVYYRHLFNGKVFTTSDNLTDLDPYNVSSVGAEYQFDLLQGLSLGFQVLNVWDEEYQNIAVRPMPGRNYNMYLNFKF